MREYRIDPENRAAGNPIRQDLTYFSDALGEAKSEGKAVDITALPKELQVAKKELFSDRFISLCYLARYKGEYGIALVNEFDQVAADRENTDMDGIYGIMLERIQAMENSPTFSEMSFLAGMWTGFGECHEAILFIPWNIPKPRAWRAVKAFDKIYNPEAKARPLLSVRRTTETATLPVRSKNGAPWYTLQADISEPVTIPPGNIVAFETGLEIMLPESFIGEVHALGSLAHAKKLCSVDTVIGGREFSTLRIVLENQSWEAQIVHPGEKLARLVIQQCVMADLEEVE